MDRQTDKLTSDSKHGDRKKKKPSTSRTDRQTERVDRRLRVISISDRLIEEIKFSGHFSLPIIFLKENISDY